MEYNQTIFDTYLIYSILLSGIIGYLYIDYLSNIKVNINKINLSKLLDFIELFGSLLIFFIIFYGIYKITVMYSTGSKLSQLLVTTVKLAQIAGGSALTYNALRNSGGGGFGSGNNDNDNNKDDKDKKKDNNNKDNDKTKTKEPISDNNKTTSTPIVNISIIKLLFEINNNKYFLFKN